MILHQCNIIMVPYGDDSILSCNMLMVASCGVYFSFTETADADECFESSKRQREYNC